MKICKILVRREAIVLLEEIGEFDGQVHPDGAYVIMGAYDCMILMSQAASFLAIAERKAEILNNLLESADGV